MSTNNPSVNANADISSLVKRLEQATSRLEDILDKKAGSVSVSSSNPGSSVAHQSSSASVPFVAAYEEFLASSLEAFVSASASLKGSDLIKNQVR